MSKIERIEKLLKKWKAAEKSFWGSNCNEEHIFYGGQKAFKAALKILKQPPDTQMHMDGLCQCPYEKATRCRMDEPCRGCETWAAHQ